MYELQTAELEQIRAAVSALGDWDTVLQSSAYAIGSEVERCSICGTRLAIDHVGPCSEQELHAEQRLLRVPVAAADIPTWEPEDEDDSRRVSHYTVGKTATAAPSGSVWVSTDRLVKHYGNLEKLHGIGSEQSGQIASEQLPRLVGHTATGSALIAPSAARYVAERAVTPIDWQAVGIVQRSLLKDAAERRRVAMLCSILHPLASRSRASKRLHLASFDYSALAAPSLLSAATAALAVSSERASKRAVKQQESKTELVAGGNIAAALSGGSSAYLLQQYSERVAKRQLAEQTALAAGKSSSEARKIALKVHSVADMGTYAPATRVSSGKVTNGSVLVKPELTDSVGRTSAGGRPMGKRGNSSVTLYRIDPRTGERVLMGKVNSGNGKPRKMRALASKATELYTAAELAELAALQGKRGGASSKKRKAIHAAAAARA